MNHRNLTLTVALALVVLTACKPAVQNDTSENRSLQPAHPMETEEQTQEYNAQRESFAMEGEKVLPTLTKRMEPSQGVIRYQGEVPHDGSTAYLSCGRLGEDGAVFMRFIVRNIAREWLNAETCTVMIDGKSVSTFPLNKERLEKSPDGKTIEYLDADFINIRPAILAIVQANAAILQIKGAKGTSEIHLNPPQIEEMKKVLAAYEYLTSSSSAK